MFNNAAVRKIFYPKSLSQQMVRVKNDGRASNPVFTAAKIIAITLLITLCYLWSRLEVISLGYDIARANKEQAEFVNENKRLKLEILSLKSPQRIEALVSERLGLVYPRGEQLIIVKK